jgi:hypothetical protein
MSSTLSIPMLTATSNNFLEFQSRLRRVLLYKGLWHICDPSAEILTRPKIQVEKGASQVPGYIAPTPVEQSELLTKAEIVQNHEVVLLMANSLCFSLHHLLDPIPMPIDTRLGLAVYKNIERHFMQSNEWTKSEIKHKWDTIVLTNTRDTYSLMTKVFQDALSAGVPLTHHEAAVKFDLLQPINYAYIPILQDALRDPCATLDSIWPTVTHTASLLRLFGAPSHAHSANVQCPARTPFRRDPCKRCGAPGHDELQCYSKDPANLLLHPPRQG